MALQMWSINWLVVVPFSLRIFLSVFCIWLYVLMFVFYTYLCIYITYVAPSISITSNSEWYRIFFFKLNSVFSVLYFNFRPELFSWDEVIKMSPVERLEHAFSIAKNHLEIEKLLDPEGAIQLFYLILNFLSSSERKRLYRHLLWIQIPAVLCSDTLFQSLTLGLKNM